MKLFSFTYLFVVILKFSSASIAICIYAKVPSIFNLTLLFNLGRFLKSLKSRLLLKKNLLNKEIIMYYPQFNIHINRIVVCICY